ncbi:MAG: CPBP family intramembrane metalloprotease [Acidobacteria bacterium]|nr:CPBP family intramembrane metalloprotease [Acidobacteriota bacterium]
MIFQQDPDHEKTPGTLAEPQPVPGTNPRPPRETWRLRDLLLFILFIPVALVVANLAAAIGYAVLAPIVGWTTPIYRLQKNVIFLLTLQFIFYIFLFVYIYFLVTVYYHKPFWEGLRWEKLSGHNVLRFFLGGTALSLVVMIIPPFLPEKKGFPLEKLFSSPSSAYAIAVFAVLIAPFMEELLFRGLLFAFFEKHGGLTFAVAATALLFAGLHIPEYWGAWDHVIMILIVGLILSLARGITRSVTPSYILHLAYNGTLIFLLYIQTQHFQKFPHIPHV